MSRWFALLPAALLPGCVPLGFPLPSDLTLLFNVGGQVTPIQRNAAPVFRTAPVFESIPGKVGSHAPTLTALPDGELLAAWYTYTGPDELDGSAIYTACLPRGRAVWEPPELHVDRPAGDGNPVLYSEGNAVWLFQAVVPCGWSTARIEVQRSFDRGETWSAPRLIDGPLGANVRSGPIRTADGTLLLPAYDDLLQRSLFFASADGENWLLRSAVATSPPFSNIQPSVAPLADGRLLAVMRNAGQGWLWVTASDDGGRSWSPPADSGFPNPASPAALLRLASGNLTLVFNDSNAARRPLSITISGDGGLTWYPPRVLASGEGSYSYPAAVQTPDALIHIVYSHNRERIGHTTLNEAWISAGVD